VAKKDLDRAQVHAGFKEVGSEGVAQRVGLDGLVDPAGPASLAEGALDRRDVKRPVRAGAGEEEGSRGTVDLPVLSELPEESGREHDVAVLLPLALLDA